MKDAEVKRKTVFETLRSEIRSGKYVSSSRFPSETALVRRFACSRPIVASAIASLEHLGLVQRRQGSGTYLTRRARRFGSSIGLIVPGIGCGEIFPPICRELSRIAQSEGISLLFGSDTADSVAARVRGAMDMARQFVAKKVSGVIFQPLEFVEDSERHNTEIVGIFTKAGIPVVLIDCDIVPSPRRSPCDLVGINNFDAGRMLAEHMLSAGARHVKVLCRPLCASTVMDRILGVQSVLGARRPEDITVTADPADEEPIARAVRGKNGADAFICANDAVASWLLVSLRKLGKRVPEDVLVAGVDDVRYATLVTPPLTTVHQPCEEIAATAFGCLLARIDHPATPPRECLLRAPLVVRRSTVRHPPGERPGKERT